MGTEETSGHSTISSLMRETDEDAEEVFLLMHGDVRVSRSVRSKWFFDHIGKQIRLSENFDSNDGITIVGMSPKRSDEPPPSSLRVSKNTTLSFFSNRYRFVFVFDLSPSVFAADEDGEICYVRIFESAVACLRNLVKSFAFPGGLVIFRPQIYATFCAFSPYLSFTDDSVLLQGIHVTEENIRVVTTNLRRKFHEYINNLCSFFQPFIRDWATERRKFRTFARNIEDVLYATNPEANAEEPPPKVEDVDKFISDFRLQMVDTRCSGFVQPDWSLIAMLRMGLLGIQMMQDNAQSHVVIATDGCCAIPNDDALEQMISQLRSYTITCSFIQTNSSDRGAALGHVNFSEFFSFLSTATFGTLLNANQMEEANAGQMNVYHRSFLSWAFQRSSTPETGPLIPDVFRPNAARTVKTRQHHQYYKTSVFKLLYIRLREGYTIKCIDHFVHNNRDMIKIFLTLQWKQDTLVEYVISAPWRRNLQKVSKIFVEIFVETLNVPLRFLQFAAEESGESSMQAAIENLIGVDNLLIQMHAFNLNPAVYALPRELGRKVPFFEQANGKLLVNDLFNKPKYQQFARFWLPVCIINESMWGKWVHLSTLRILLAEDHPLPKGIFTKSVNNPNFDQIQCRNSGRLMLELLTRRATFVLLRDQCFVNILFTQGQSTPQYFYVIRVIYDSPCMILKIAFLGGMSANKRNQILHSLKDDIVGLSMIKSITSFVNAPNECQQKGGRKKLKTQNSIEKKTDDRVVEVGRLFQRPMERILVRYTRVPLDIARIVRLEKTESESEIREMIMHNAVAKYLSCRRMVWELKPTFPRLHGTPTATMEFMLQLIIKRHLHQGFSIAYGENGIVNLIRQVNTHGRGGESTRVEQCVIFGPVMTDTDLPPPANQYENLDQLTTYFDVLRREADLRSRPKSWPRLAVEVWLEPQGEVNADLMSDDESTSERMPHVDGEENKRERLLKEADTIIRSVFTFDQLMRAAESGMHAEEAFVLNKVSSVMTREALSGAVDCYKDIFDPKALMDNADTRQFMLLPALGYSKNEPAKTVDARLESLLKFVEAELVKYCDCCVDALDDAFLWDIVETCEDHFKINRFFSPDQLDLDEATGDSRTNLSFNRLRRGAPQRNSQRDSEFSCGSSAESTGSDVSYSTKNGTSGANTPVSESVFDELMIGSKPFDSPLSRSMTAFGAENDLYSVADDAAVAALSGLQAELDRRTIPGGVPSDSEDNTATDDLPPAPNQPTVSLLPLGSAPGGSTSTESAAFITDELLSSFDRAIAFNSKKLSDFPSKAASSPTNEPKKEKRLTVPEEAANLLEKQKKTAAERSRNASGIDRPPVDKKHSREEERKRHDSDSPGPTSEPFNFDRPPRPHVDWHAKEEKKEEELKKFPPIPLGGFGVYVRRLNAHRLILYFVPKNAKTVRLLMPHVTNAFPVFSYFVDKLQMAQNFVEFGGANEEPHPRIRTIVEDFTNKAHTSTLAHLNQDVNDRLVRDCTRGEEEEVEEVPLDEFFLRALDSSLRAPLEPMSFQLNSFDLRAYSERVFEEYVFTKAFIAAAFSSIGQSVDVPSAVLREAAETRCEYTSVELGSINSIMQSSCLHLQAYENLPNQLTSSTSDFDPLALEPLPRPVDVRPFAPRRFFRFANGCLSAFDGWAASFRKLLQVHSFKPVPGLPDYYFFWPYRKAVLRFANIDDVSLGFADVFRAIGEHPTIPENDEEARKRNESGNRILAEAGNATQLSPADMWPLFIQLYVAVASPDGEMETDAVSTVPNCLRQVAEGRFTRVLQLETEGLTGQSLRVTVDLYVLTWPLPRQCPFRLIDPHLVYARYQQTQSELAAMNRANDPDDRRNKRGAKSGHRVRFRRQFSDSPTSSPSSLLDPIDDFQMDEDVDKHAGANTETESEEEDAHPNASTRLNYFERAEKKRKVIDEIRRSEHSKRTFEFLAQLPRVEQYAVKRLQLAVKRFISSELVFGWARECEQPLPEPQPSRRMFQTISQFIARMSPPKENQMSSSVCTEAVFNTCVRTVILAGDARDGFRRLCGRLEGLPVDYTRLRRFDPCSKHVDDTAMEEELRFVDGRSETEDEEASKTERERSRWKSERRSDSPIFFYACGVEDIQEFDEYFVSSQLNADGPHEAFREPPITPPAFRPHRSTGRHLRHLPHMPYTPAPTSPVVRKTSVQSVGHASAAMSTAVSIVDAPFSERRRRRASSCGPDLEKRIGQSDSSSELSEGELTYDTVFTLNDASERVGPPILSDGRGSRRVLPLERRNRLQRQVSTHSSCDSLPEEQSDGTETSASSSRSGRSTPANLRTPDAPSTVGSSGTWVAAHQTVGGQDAPKWPSERAKQKSQESIRTYETRNGFPLDWLVECGVYSEKESLYAQKREPYLHDFWLVLKVVNSASESSVTVYFIRRAESPHKMIARNALRVLDEQIRIVNQQLLLDSMQKTEECDDLLLDSPDVPVRPKPIHRHITVRQKDRKGRLKTIHIPCVDESERCHAEEGASFSGEGRPLADAALLKDARFCFKSGHFACDAVWYHWFEIHPRLQPHSRHPSGSADWGLRTLQLGLERFAVKNRSNLYVFREQKADNVVYLRLYPNDPEALRDFDRPPYTRRPTPPAGSRLHSHVLLAVHGVEKPSDEVTELLRKMLEKRLDARILSEIQDLLLRNVQTRLDVSDAQFIQKDPQSPNANFFYSVAMPPNVSGLLRPLVYYIEQQALVFCNTAHIREQSGRHGSSTLRSPHSNIIGGFSHVNSQCSHLSTAFTSHTPNGLPPNPPDYQPLFFLVNRPSVEGRRDIGLACIEIKFLDSNLQAVSKMTQTGGSLAQSTRQVLLYPSRPKMSAKERLEKMYAQTTVNRIKSPPAVSKDDGQPTNSAFLQVSIWEHGRVDLNELGERFGVCLQQAICDVYTEFGLLSLPILETSPIPQLSASPNLQPVASAPAVAQTVGARSPSKSTTTTIPNASPPAIQSQSTSELNAAGTWSNPPITLDDAFLNRAAAAVIGGDAGGPMITATSSTGDLDTYTQTSSQAVFPCHQHEDRLPMAKSGRQSSGSVSHRPSHRPADDFRPGRLASVGAQPSQSIFSAAAAAASAISGRATGFRRGPSQPPLTPTKTISPPFTSANNSRTSLVSLSSVGRLSSAAQPPPPSPTPSIKVAEWLRPDFARTTADWFDFVSSTVHLPTPEAAQTSVLRRHIFEVECETTTKRILYIVHDQLKQLYPTERVLFCRGSTPTPGGHSNEFSFAGQSAGRRLQALHSAASFLEPFERDIGRTVSDREMALDASTDEEWNAAALETISADDETVEVDLALLVFNEREYGDSIAHLSAQQQQRSRGMVPLPERLASLCNPTSREAQLQFFAPFKDPYIPRQRLLFLVARGRDPTLTLFSYNYSPKMCETTRGLVNRTTLWQNARTCLLRDIGLQKLGLTHLTGGEDEDNPYIPLIFKEPELLIRYEFPPDDLEIPDYAKVPREYIQRLFKLYRFAEPAFVAKNFSTDPFEDQTQQMMTLREDVRVKLNEQRTFREIHEQLLKGETKMEEEEMKAITSRAHHAHFVQSPLLLFTSWRCRIGAIRQNLSVLFDASGGQKGSDTNRLTVDSKRPTEGGGPLSPVRPTGVLRPPLQKLTARTAPTTAMLPIPTQGKGRSKTLNVAPAVPALKQYLKRSKADVLPESSASSSEGRQPTGLGFRVAEHELCLLKVQYMLVEEYVDYLQRIGLRLLKIVTSEGVPSTPYNLNYTPDCSESPQVWLYAARAGGIIFAHLTFVEPYFSLRFLFWNASQLSDNLITTHFADEMEAMREVELLKNDLIQHCHVHSFTYDFHLRMVSTYLTGGSQVLFNPGYNTHAFLIDFLRYYNQRPPFARNCIYEERAMFQPLRVSGATVWDHFLSNEQHFGWNVVRIKNQSTEPDEFMLIAKETREISDQSYHLISIVLNDMKAASTKGEKIELKFFILMVCDDIKHPFPDNINLTMADVRPRLESGKFHRHQPQIEHPTVLTPISDESTLSIVASPKKSLDSSSSSGGSEFIRLEPPVSPRGGQTVDSKMVDVLGGRILRLPPPGQAPGDEEYHNELDQLIAKTTDDLMYDVGLNPSSSSTCSPPTTKRSVDETNSKSRQLQKREPVDPRRRWTSGDPVGQGGKLTFVKAKETSRQPVTDQPTSKTRTEKPAGGNSSANIRSTSSESRTKIGKDGRRNSAIPLSGRHLSGSMTRLDITNALDDVWKSPPKEEKANEEQPAEFSIQKVPIRRHRQPFVDYVMKRNTDVVLSHEQVTYVHYQSSQQIRLQHLLEETAWIKKKELESFVLEAERICYVNSLWTLLLSAKSGVRPKASTTLFSSATSSKHDSGEMGSGGRIPLTEMNADDFDSLLSAVCIESMGDEEPQLMEQLKKANFHTLCSYLLLHYEQDKLFRYFERPDHNYLILLNPSHLDSAMMLRDDGQGGDIELFIVFKETDIEKWRKQTFASNAVHKKFEELINHFTMFFWIELLQSAPSIK